MSTKSDRGNVVTMQQMKRMIYENLGSPANNQNAASALAGTRFKAESKDGRFVVGTLLPTLSSKGKIQAELACSEPGCGESHVREQSDWHQSMLCRIHAANKRVRLTDDEKALRKVARAKAVIAQHGDLDRGNSRRPIPPPPPSA